MPLKMVRGRSPVLAGLIVGQSFEQEFVCYATFFAADNPHLARALACLLAAGSAAVTLLMKIEAYPSQPCAALLDKPPARGLPALRISGSAQWIYRGVEQPGSSSGS